MNNYLNNTTTILFTTSQLIFHYFHISAIKKFINYSTKKYLIGYYCNYSLVNMYLNMWLIKNTLNLMLKILLKNGKVLIFSEYYESDLFDLVKKLFRFLKIFFCFQKWKPGTLKLLKRRKFNRKNLFLLRIPNIILIAPTYNTYSKKNIVKEASDLTMLTCTLIDSSFNLFMYTFFVFTNLKSFKAGFFYLKMVEKLFIKSFFLKKEYFCLTILQFLIKFIKNKQ